MDNKYYKISISFSGYVKSLSFSLKLRNMSWLRNLYTFFRVFLNLVEKLVQITIILSKY